MIPREDGFTLPELLVGMAVSLLTLSVTATIVIAATHNQHRIANRVDANQRVRPVLTRIVDELHSACVAPRTIPVVGDSTANGSTDTKITFLSQAGNAVIPAPDKHVIAYTVSTQGTPPRQVGTLIDQVFPLASGNSPTTWRFQGTADPLKSRTLLTDLPPTSGVLFTYYRYQNGQLSTTPLSVPLSANDAGFVTYVGISISANPTGGPGVDAQSPITISDGVDLRLQPASQVAGQDNLPCT